MNEKYSPAAIEPKWQQAWAEGSAFTPGAAGERPEYYVVEMLAYTSGRLHMGHVENYSIGDALAWYKRMRGYNVFHPFGWDAFGQPAEQAAIKHATSLGSVRSTKRIFDSGRISPLVSTGIAAVSSSPRH